MNSKRLLETLSDLIRINSVNTAYDPACSEAEVARSIRERFAHAGIETFTQPVYPGRDNVIARLPGRTAARVILEAHMDTVSVSGMTIDPFDPVVRQGRLYGRGACDTKAGLAAMMEAVLSLNEEGVAPPCEVWFCAVVDEEHSFGGVRRLCEGLHAAGAIVAEPTSLRLVRATKGVLRWQVHTHGRAAHSAKPHLGVNAIEHMAMVVLAAAEENRRLARRTSHPLLGPATINVGIISGGAQVNFVPDRATIHIDRRLLPGEKVDAVMAEFQGILDRLAAPVPGFAAVQDPPMLADEALETPEDAAVVKAAARALDLLGLVAAAEGVPYGSDASKLSRQGIPAIVFGPGSIDQAHGAVEWVSVAEVEQAARFYRTFLEEFHR